MKLTETIGQIGNRVWMASRVAALTGGTKGVDGVVITAGGSGYTTVPTVAFTGGAGAGAAGTAVVSGGVVQSVTMTNPGTGYTSAPTVGFSGGGGSGAAGTAVMLALTLDSIPTLSISLLNPLFVMFMLSGHVNQYRLRTGTDAESSPWIIRPDDYAGTTNEKVWEFIGGNVSKITKPIKTLTYAATVNIDFDGPDELTVSLTGNVLFTSTNRGAGKRARILIVCDGTGRTTGFEAWTVVGAALPASLVASKSMVLDLLCYGTTVASVVATGDVQL